MTGRMFAFMLCMTMFSPASRAGLFDKINQVTNQISQDVKQVHQAISNQPNSQPGTTNSQPAAPPTTQSSGANNKPGTTTVEPTASVAPDKMKISGNNVTAYLRKSAEPIPMNYPGVSLDILGIKPGMSVGNVQKILTSYYKSAPKSYAGTIGGSYKGVLSVVSQPYTNTLYDSNQAHSDFISVFFGNQTTGNTVVAIDRKITFTAENGPNRAAVYASLSKKYGRQISWGDDRGYDSRHWIFGKTHLLTTSSVTGRADWGNWPCITADINPGNEESLYTIDMTGHLTTNLIGKWTGGGAYSAYAKLAMSAGQYVCAFAEALPLDADKSRVAQIEEIINDPADEVLTLTEARQQLLATALAAYKKLVKPESTPSL